MRVKKKDIVSVADTKGNKTPEKWKVVDVTGNRITVIPEDGEESNKKTFHCSRILECNGKDTGALDIAERQTSINSKFKVKKTKKTKKAASKKKKEKKEKRLIKLDLSSLTKDGSELHRKVVEGFDHDMEVVSYCLIASDKKSYKYFNLYDGSLGKNGGKTIPKNGYKIRDRKNGYKKLLNSLSKKGYKKV